MNPKLFSLAMNEIGERYIEEALTYQAPAKHRRAKLLRMALAACLAMVLALGTAMAVSDTFRQAVAGWVRAQYETFTHYRYGGEGSAAFVPYRLTELPAGYAETGSICDEEIGQQMIFYQNGDGRSCFVSVSAGGNAFVETEGTVVLPVEVDGAAGEVYLPDDAAKDSSLVWAKDDLFFCISGHFTPEELVYYAERLRPMTP